jgi:caffeoyl-CoA O-methyltransferase
MANRTLGLSPDLHAYLVKHGVREHPVLAQLRAATAHLPEHAMQVPPEEGAFLAMLVRLLNARYVLEVGTFTGYSSTAMALALPADGRIVCCDVSREWTDVARRAWTDAEVADRIELRLAPARATLDALLAEGRRGSFDFAFIDADPEGCVDYYDRALRLVRRGGLIAIDNVRHTESVADPFIDNSETNAMRRLSGVVATDERVDLAIVPIADGVTLARVR